MAPEDSKSKKRKGATDSDPKPKKMKKTDDSGTSKKASKALKSAVEPIDSVQVPTKSSRKRAVDFFDASQDPPKDESAKEKPEKAKKSKAVVDEILAEEASINGRGSEIKPEKTKKAKKSNITVENTPATSEAIDLKVNELNIISEKPQKTKKSKTTTADMVTEEPTKPTSSKSKKAKTKITEDVALEVDGKKIKKSKVLMETNPIVEEDGTAQIKKVPTKKTTKTATGDDIEASDLAKSKKAKASEKTKKQEPAKEPSPAGEEDDDDQTELLAGFESTDDESATGEEGNGIDLAKLPVSTSIAMLADLNKASKKVDEAGVVYIGRLPHGFYEHQMRAYFSQFGEINKLRLSRNKKTGASRHHAWIEFASAGVADIVATAMDNYLLFNHLLRVKVVPPAQVSTDLFKGANKRYKPMPRTKMQGAGLRRGAEREVWEKRVANETRKRSAKNKKLKEALGYEFEAPKLKAVSEVPKKVAAVEAEDVPKLLTEVPHEDELQKAMDTVTTAEAGNGVVTVTEKVKVKKSKKADAKRKDPERATEEPAIVEDAKHIKGKRSKKETKAMDDDELPKAGKRKVKSTGDEDAKVKKVKKAKVSMA